MPKAPKSALASPHDARPASMLRATLTGPETPQAGANLTLHAQIERFRALPGPVTIELVLPEGVVLLEGEPKLALPPNTQARSDVLRYVIRADVLPASDVRLKVHAGGLGFAYHTERPYRFGRAAPTALPAILPRSGTPLRVGDKSFGRSVDITPR